MTDKNGTILILEGKEYKLKYTLLALALLEKEGINLAQLGDNMTMDSILKVVWAGLKTNHPKLTVEQVGGMIDIADLPIVSEKLGEAFGGLQGKKQ